MKNSFLCSVRQGIQSPRFFVSLVAVAVVIFLSSLQQLVDVAKNTDQLATGFHVTFVIHALSQDGLFFITPIAAAIPLSAIYVEDLKSNYIRLFLFRCSRRQYVAGRICGCYLSGGLVLFLGILLAYGVSFLLFAPMEASKPDLVQGQGIPEVLQAALPFFLSGGFWAVFGLAISTWMESRYIAYASPFIAFYVLVILRERYFYKFYILSPKEWLSPSENWFLGNWGLVIFSLELSFLTALVFALRAGRRLMQL